MATFMEHPSGTVGHYADDSRYPIWCDNPEDWEGLDCQLVDQTVTASMIKRAKGRPPGPPETKRKKVTRRRKVSRVVLKGDDV